MDLGSFHIGVISRVDYVMRTVDVVIPPGGYSGLPEVGVISSIQLGTKDAPIVTPGRKALIWRPSGDDRFNVIEIDPMIAEPITRLSDLIACAYTIATIHETSEIWWRGHSKSDWTLVPGVYRKGKPHKYETSIISHFMMRARTRHLNCPPDDKITSWLLLMQHYGLPTRLLDWTESPLIAAFFAVSYEPQIESVPETDACIWALNPFALNNSQINQPLVAGILREDSPAIPLFVAAHEINLPYQDKILAISNPELDFRMLLQLAQFTIHGSPKPLEQLTGNQEFLHKLIIPASAKRKIRDELELMGIKQPNLFPDLQNLAKYLADKEFD